MRERKREREREREIDRKKERESQVNDLPLSFLNACKEVLGHTLQKLWSSCTFIPIFIRISLKFLGYWILLYSLGLSSWIFATLGLQNFFDE